MFNQNLIVAVKANGKVLREVKDTCYIPFGSHYSILIKNMDSRRVQVKVHVDGTDATEGTALVIEAHSEIEFERFIKNGNLKEGNKFKFIERTAEIENHRGSKVDDGFIRVEYQFEYLYPQVNTWNNNGWVYKSPGLYDGTFYGNDVTFTTSTTAGEPVTKGILRGATLNATASVASASVATNAVNTAYTAQAAVQNEVGITVPGAHSSQSFKTAAWFPVESTKHVIALKLLGESPEGKKVEAPVTVKAKPKCETCGRTNKATAKFCSECGTSLILF
jgi:hypothetical protein